MNTYIKNRHPLAVLGLSIITLGLYCIYWLHATRKEVVRSTGDAASIPRLIFLYLPVLCMALPLVGAMVAAGAGGGELSDAAAGILLIAVLLGFLFVLGVALWWFYKYCMAVGRLTSATNGTNGGVLYVLWVVLICLAGVGPIWMMIVQNELNDHAAKASASPSA